MAGSLISGYALSVISTTTTLWVSLAYLYVVAAVGRGAAALLHFRLPYQRPWKATGELSP
jgi:hypothetical protein